MGIPFSVIQGLVAVIDAAGNIVETALTAGKRRLTAQSTIIGSNNVGTVPSPQYLEASVIAGSDARNRLCVDTIINQDNQTQYLSSKYRIVVNTTTANIPQSTSWTTVASYSGTGFFFGLHVDQDKDDTQFQFIVDGETIISGVSIAVLKDFGFVIGTSVPAQFQNRQLFVTSNSNDIDFCCAAPVRFNTNWTFQMRNPNRPWIQARYLYQHLPLT